MPDARPSSTRYKVLQGEANLGEDRGADDIELILHNSAQRETSPKPHTTTASDLLLPKQDGQHPAQEPTRHRLLSGWRVGALVSLIGAVSVFMLNFVMTLWVWKNPNYEIQGATGTLLQGSCATVRRLNVWVHLLVNVLSTLLLCASNYCMQVLVAPTRTELDRAHSHRQWLHIGVPSLHNLMRIGRVRTLLWTLLLMSSLPLHLLFNSVVFTNLQANEYMVIPTTESWLHGAAYDSSNFLGFQASNLTTTIRKINEYRPNLTETIILADNSTVPRYTNVSTAECFNKYNAQYISDVGNVYLIQSGSTVWRNQSIYALARNRTGDLEWTKEPVPEGYTKQQTGSSFPFLSKPDYYPSNGWRCPSHRNMTCNVGDEREVPRDRSKWAPYERPLKYCMVEQVPEICKLQFSFLIATIVVVSNLVKVAVIGWLLVRFSSFNPLVTLGDAVASWLQRPDPETRDRCLQSRYRIQMDFNRRSSSNTGANLQRRLFRDTRNKPIQFKLKRENWSQAPSYYRWFGTYFGYAGTIVLGTMCIIWSLRGMPSSAAALWKIGFGTVNGINLLDTSTTLMGGVILANSPQVMLSYLYLAFNALYTSMFIGYEWSSYMNTRKTLRVTSPAGQQRHTYWLSVPFRFAIPMTIVSGLFHWLVSQSLFMVQIRLTDATKRDMSQPGHISTCGYSPFAIILTVVTATVIAIGGIALGRFKHPAGMPIVGSCSAAISAGCHPPLEDVDAHLRPVQWGAVTHGAESSGLKEPVGHCSFSSLPVETPICGRLYA